MSTRSSYPSGVPCWVAVICPDDAEPAKAFYTALFGWGYENIAGEDDPPFYIATLAGGRVASLAGSGNGEPGVWITAVSVTDREDAADRVRAAGGSAAANDTVEIESIGRFHRVEDPAGAEIHLAQIEGTAAERVNEPGAWSMSHLYTPDLSAVAPFYEEVFGWRTEGVGPNTLFHLPGHAGDDAEQPILREVVAAADPVDESAEAVWRPNFWVTDAQKVSRAAADHGGQVLTEPTETVNGLITAELADPGGARFTISGRRR